MKNLQVSVIITAYNEEKYIQSCLESLLNQTYKPIEILVTDDGSTDKTRAIIKKYPVKLVSLNHQGTAIARNKAVDSSTGEIVCFLDADMEFAPDFVEKLVQPILEKRTKGTFSKLEYVKNWDNPYARCWNRNNAPELPDKLRIPQNITEGDDFRAILTSEFQKVNGFDNTGYTDTWSLKKKLGYSPQNAPDAVYYHHNPDTLKEIFASAQWIGKRNYKFGKLGSVITVIRSFVLLSLVKGVMNALKYKEPAFIPFKIVYDFGITKGAFMRIVSDSVKK